jgi:deazaflavin-dependent oxidoreductase (nitroreductase family)
LFEQAHPVHRFMRATGATAPMSWLSARVMHRLDKGVHRITAGRTTFAGIVTGLPVVMLTTTGARSGQPRTWPLLGLRDGDRIVVVASNYGQRNHPAWYHNLRANPIASVAVDGAATQMLAEEARGDERDRLWRAGLRVYPGWAAYERRAAPRRIPVSFSPHGSDDLSTVGRKVGEEQRGASTSCAIVRRSAGGNASRSGVAVVDGVGGVSTTCGQGRTAP